MFVDFLDMEISVFIWYIMMKKFVIIKYLNLLKNYLKCIFEFWKELLYVRYILMLLIDKLNIYNKKKLGDICFLYEFSGINLNYR